MTWSLPNRALYLGGRTWEGFGEALSEAGNLWSALCDWFHDINRGHIIAFARERFPEEYRQLDGGDRRIMASFLDPESLSNTESIFGDPRSFIGAMPTWVLSCLGLSARILGTFGSDPYSEYALGFCRFLDLLNDALGTHADDDTPVILNDRHVHDGSERWFFINGVATSRELARLNANRLHALLKRDIVVIHNPTGGLTADLVESAMEKFTNVNTEPVALAFVEIAKALMDPKVLRVAVVAHSQGTIITGDVLDLIYYALDPVGKTYLDKTNMNSEDVDAFLSKSRGIIKSDDLQRAVASLRNKADVVADKLELYMFANAASRMCYLDPGRRRPHIESFANEHDLVARLGCLAEDTFHEEDLLRIDGPVFMARGRYGHLLNAHYLRDLRDYKALPDNGAPSHRRSLHEEVLSNPCARNPKRTPGDPAAPSRLLGLLPP